MSSYQECEEQLAKVREIEARCEQVKRQWAIQLKVRMSLLTTQGTPEYDREAYYYRRGKMAELEVAITKAEWDAELARDIYYLMLPERHKPRRIKSAPTKYVRGPNGTKIPRSK